MDPKSPQPSEAEPEPEFERFVFSRDIELQDYAASPLLPKAQPLGRIPFCAQTDFCAKHPSVSKFWSEKLFIVLDYLQIFGIISAISTPWPWPYAWTSWTSWVMALNLDFTVLIGDYSWGLAYMILWTLVPFLLLVVLLLTLLLARLLSGTP